MSSNNLSISGNSDAQGIKSIRLRAACNPCHNAKIRCSGERDGCTRCRNLNHVDACKYGVSRVGKASIRNKRGKSPDESESMDGSSRSSSSRGFRASTWEPTVAPGKKFNIQDPFDDQLMNWATSDGQPPNFDLSNVGQAEPDSSFWQQPPPNRSYESHLPSPPEFDAGTIISDFNAPRTVSKAGYEQHDSDQLLLEILRPSSTRQQQQHQRLQSPPSQAHYSDSTGSANPSDQSSLSFNHSITSANSANSSNSSTSNASQCISLCTQVISYLESQTSDSSLGLDSVLRISKSCISGLLPITTLENCKTNPNCLLLLCVALNQMITLFENNIPAMNSLLNSPSVSTLPSLLFGSFPVDQEDQLAFCTRLICREIRRCKKLLDRVNDIHNQQQSYQSNSFAHSAASLLRNQWFLASAERLDNLDAAVAA